MKRKLAVLLAALALVTIMVPTVALAHGGHHGYASSNNSTAAYSQTHSYGWCNGYADVDGNGYCDNCGRASKNCPYGWCNNYVDANKDGYCDRCARGSNYCPYVECDGFVDANGDGYCDHCDRAADYCRGYVDSNGDGICDNYSHNIGHSGYGCGSRYGGNGYGCCGNGRCCR